MAEIKGKALQNKKKQMILLGLIGAMVIGLATVASLFTTDTQIKPPPPKAPDAKLIAVPGGKGDEKTSWRAKEAVRLQAQNDALNQQMSLLQKRLADFQEQQKQKEFEKAELERKEKERLALEQSMPKPPSKMGSNNIPDPNINIPAKGNVPNPKINGLNQNLSAELETSIEKKQKGIMSIPVYVEQENKQESSKVKSIPEKILNHIEDSVGGLDDGKDQTYMPAGSFVRVVMLSGLDAPTGGQAQNNPHPILFRVLDPAQLPNMFKSDVKDCVITGNGYGDLSAERVHIRTDRLSCIDEDGNSTDIKLTGYAAGEDGKEGMRGRLVTKQGQVIAKAMLAGLVDGIGTIVKQSSMTQTTVGGVGTSTVLDPNQVVQAGVGGAIGNAGTVLSKYYMNLANQLFPVLEVDAGRVVDVVLSQGVRMGVKER